MKRLLKKAATIVGSIALIGSSIGAAAAAAYPAPFVEGGVADVAIVYGAEAASADIVAAGNIQSDLSTSLASQTASSSSTTPTVSGEAYALFTSGTKIYIDDALNVARSTVTKSAMPTVLADGTFDSNSSVDYSQKVIIRGKSTLNFDKHPSSDDDPTLAINITDSSFNTLSLYNATITFDSMVSLNAPDSVGSKMTLFGKEYTVGASTSATKLYLYESSETVSLSIGGADPKSAVVTVNGNEYTVELDYSEDTKASIKVTDSDGNSQSKEIDEDDSKKVQGVDVAVDSCNEAADGLQVATITVGADKLLLQDGQRVKVGSDEDEIEGTLVSGASNWGQATRFTICVGAEDDDVNAILPGESFVDPVFGTFKIDLASLTSDGDREIIDIEPSTDTAKVTFTSHTGDTKGINWYNNESNTFAHLADTSNNTIHVSSNCTVNDSEYVVVGNEDDGYLLEFVSLSNSSSDTDDTVRFKDVFSGETYDVSVTSEGAGTLTLPTGGDLDVIYVDKSSSANDYVQIGYPDATNVSEMIVYPTIETSKGAKFAFYEPLIIDLSNPFSNSGVTNVRLNTGGTVYTENLDSIRFPDGDGYTDVGISFARTDSNNGGEHWNIDGSVINVTAAGNSSTVTIGELTYFLNSTADNQTTIHLADMAHNAIKGPALIIFEEQDDDDDYEVLIVQMDDNTGSNDKVGVADVESTYQDKTITDYKGLESNDDLDKYIDLWGSMITIDKSASDQYSAEISYPDDQLSANLYVAEESASITGGSSSTATATELGSVTVTDTEADSVSSKNLVVVGGSCINSVAAELLGEAACGDDFTALTGIAAGEAIIKSYSRNSKVALLVAGYNAADTTNAAVYLQNKAVDTTVGEALKVTSATTAEAITEAATTETNSTA